MNKTTKTAKAKFYYQDGRGQWHPTNTKTTQKFVTITSYTKTTDQPITWSRQVTAVLTAKQFAKLGKTAVP